MHPAPAAGPARADDGPAPPPAGPPAAAAGRADQATLSHPALTGLAPAGLAALIASLEIRSPPAANSTCTSGAAGPAGEPPARTRPAGPT